MQNKGAIGLFAILLTLVCLFELSFTWKVNSVENAALEYAQGDPEKERAYLDSMANETIYNIFIKKYTYKECKEKELNLGLDLKGGMNVTLEVSVPDVVLSLSNYSTDPVFQNVMKQAREKYKKDNGDFVSIFNETANKIDANIRFAAPTFFGHREFKEQITPKMSNEDVLKIIREKVEASIANSYTVIRNRIDRFGVTQPNIQRLDNGNRILVELPGVKEPERVRKLLQGAAKLEFWETFDNSEVYGFLDQANTRLRDLGKAGSIDSTATDSTAIASSDSSKAVAKDSSAMSLKEKLSVSTDSGTASKDSAAQAQKSFEEFKKENPLWGLLNPSFEQTEQGNRLGQGPVVGSSMAKDTAKVTVLLKSNDVAQFLPKNIRFLWTVKSLDKGGVVYQLVAIKTPQDGKAPLTGDVITDATKNFGQFNGKPEVSMSMNGEGTAKWKKLTGENVGKSVAIVLDDAVYSFPNVNQEIAGGNSQITGNFTIKEAEDLANILNSGKMDAAAVIVEEAIVGPSLGKEAINSGLISSLAGLLLVFLFMAFYYSSGGLVADVALFANVFFLMGVMASLGAVLTLPGIAGIVLTIGMAVDANVLIYERIREEIANGKALKQAIADGYKNAYSAIIDSNVTTLLTGVILFIFGSGPIQGFATTLIIGILTSLFSAIFITRMIFEWLLSKNKKITFSIPLTQNILKDSNFNFIDGRKRFYIVSASIIVIGIGFMFTKGFGYGVDFDGGYSYVVRFEKSVPTNEVRTALYNSFGSTPDVKVFGASNQLRITTDYMIDDERPGTDSIVASKMLVELTKLSGGSTPEVVSSQKVGPTIASDIKQSAVYAVVFSLLVLFLYLLLRFRKWQYGIGAIAALAYVVLFILSIFSIFNGILPFSLDIDQSFIAAILTVVGYSINDTVVIFDRIREYLGMHKSKNEELSTVINNALNSTLSRTVVTGLSTIGVLVILFFFGGEVIRGFSFAMLIGVIVGTYTSLFVASPVVVDLTRRVVKDELKKQTA